jgi:hypothetical protein
MGAGLRHRPSDRLDGALRETKSNCPVPKQITPSLARRMAQVLPSVSGVTEGESWRTRR